MQTDPLVAELTLAGVRAVQRRNRRRAAAVRFPLSLIGVFTLIAAAWALAFGRDRIAIFYGPAIVLTAVAAGWRYRRISAREGVQASVLPWALTAVALLSASALVSQLGFAAGADRVEEAGPSLVFAAGYLLLGAWGRNRALTLASAAMIADSLLAPLFLHGDRCVAWQIGVDGVLLLAAAALTRPVAGYA
jgi:hypothetical protein